MLIGATGVLIVTSFAVAVPAGATTAQVSGFNNYVNAVKKDLSYCTAAASDVEIGLGLLLQAGNSETTGDEAKLDTASKSAQTACDETKDQHVLNVGTLGVPGSISFIHSLNHTGIHAEMWASSDTGAVLHDVQNLLESHGDGVAVASKLESDIAHADSDAATLRADFSHAAQRLGAKFSGLGLVVWGF
jgi:hypothetical protein